MQVQRKPNRWDGKQGTYHWNVGSMFYRLGVQSRQFVILSYAGEGKWEVIGALSEAASNRIYGEMWSAMNDPAE